MLSIIKNTWLIFKRNPEFLYIIVIQPILMFLIMSFLLSYSTTHKVAVVNRDPGNVGSRIESYLTELEGVDLIDIAEDEITAKITAGNIELAVLIEEDASETGSEAGVKIISNGSSQVESLITQSLNQILSAENQQEEQQALTFAANEVKKKGITVSYSLGIMIFKTLTASNLLAAMFIKDRNNKMKGRILLSGVKVGSYVGGTSLVYVLCMMLGSVVYYLVGLLFNFDFGMKHSLHFLLILFTANILSAAIYAFFSTVVSKEDSLWFMASCILLPMAIFAGVLFPFQLMPKAMQRIGNVMPQRWIIQAIENVQEKGTLAGAVPQIAITLGVSALLFAAATYRIGKQEAK